MASTLGVDNPFRYRGYYYDEESGLYYLNSRYYDPVTGRFINADGYVSGIGGDIQGYNLFAYCFNNPINLSDSNGNWPKWVSGIFDIISGACQMIGGAAIAASTSWTGVGAVLGATLMANGAGTVLAGGGKISNEIFEKDVMPEENFIKIGFTETGRLIGGESGAKISGGIYEVANFAADLVSITGTVNSAVKIAQITNKATKVEKVTFNMIKADSFFMDTYYVSYGASGGRYFKQAKTWFRVVDAIGVITDKGQKMISLFGE